MVFRLNLKVKFFDQTRSTESVTQVSLPLDGSIWENVMMAKSKLLVINLICCIYFISWEACFAGCSPQIKRWDVNSELFQFIQRDFWAILHKYQLSFELRQNFAGAQLNPVTLPCFFLRGIQASSLLLQDVFAAQLLLHSGHSWCEALEDPNIAKVRGTFVDCICSNSTKGRVAAECAISTHIALTWIWKMRCLRSILQRCVIGKSRKY